MDEKIFSSLSNRVFNSNTYSLVTLNHQENMIFNAVLLIISADIMLHRRSTAGGFIPKNLCTVPYLYRRNNMIKSTPNILTAISTDGKGSYLHSTSLVSSPSQAQPPELNPIKALFTKVSILKEKIY